MPELANLKGWYRHLGRLADLDGMVIAPYLILGNNG